VVNSAIHCNAQYNCELLPLSIHVAGHVTLLCKHKCAYDWLGLLLASMYASTRQNTQL
jgi:hypothetical protein